MIDPNHPRLSIARQCELVAISRSSFYYKGKGETVLNLELMRLIDEQFLRVSILPCNLVMYFLERATEDESRRMIVFTLLGALFSVIAVLAKTVDYFVGAGT